MGLTLEIKNNQIRIYECRFLVGVEVLKNKVVLCGQLGMTCCCDRKQIVFF